MSDPDEIPAAARTLIREHIHSIEALEVIVALYEHRAETLSIGHVAKLLRVSDSAVESAVGELERAGLAEQPTRGAVRYRPQRPEVDEAVVALLFAYEHFRVETLVLISSNAIHRVRDDALRTFAEAFRLGGRKRDG
jgi:Mn-dependent DtxR family transcriptional regulator